MVQTTNKRRNRWGKGWRVGGGGMGGRENWDMKNTIVSNLNEIYSKNVENFLAEEKSSRI